MRARPPAGWYKDPVRLHAFRYWDHNAWTSYVADNGTVSTNETWGVTIAPSPKWPRRSAGAAWRACFAVLSAIGVFLLVWGYRRYAAGIDEHLHGADYSDYYCKNDPNGQRLMGTIGPLWLPWLALTALAAVAWSLWYRIGRGDWLLLTLSVLGTVVVFVTFPLVGWIAGGMDCGL